MPESQNMKTIYTLLIYIAFCIFCAGHAHADEKKPHRMKGVIVEINDSSLTVEITAKKKSITFTVTDETTYEVDEKEVKITDLKPGMHVLVQNNKLEAAKIWASETNKRVGPKRNAEPE